MSFAWRELWSRKIEERYDLIFAVYGGVVLRDMRWAPRSSRNRNGWVQKLKFKHRVADISGALNDGGLLVNGYCGFVIIPDTGDGEMEVEYKRRAFDPPDASAEVPCQKGILYYDLDKDSLERKNVFYAPTFQDKRQEFLGLEYDLDGFGDEKPVGFSDEKHACVFLRKKKELREWDTRGRERVFPVAKESALSRVARPGGTCRGRAFLLTSEFLDRFPLAERPYQPFVYMGGGRLDIGPLGWGRWAAYGNRAYCLCDGTLTCYEALETTASLLELCASRAAAVEYTERQLGTLPLELRELLIS